MVVNIPYEIGDKICDGAGNEAVITSMHVYIGMDGEVQNIRAYTKEAGYVMLERKTRGGKKWKRKSTLSAGRLI